MSPDSLALLSTKSLETFHSVRLCVFNFLSLATDTFLCLSRRFFCHSTRLRIINWCELIRFLCENKQQRDAYAHRTHICIFIHTMCISVCGFCIEKIFAWYGVGVIRGLKADFFSSMKSVPFLTPAKKPEHTNAIVTNVSRFAFFSLSIAAFFLTFLKILLLFHRCWALSYRTWVCAL